MPSPVTAGSGVMLLALTLSTETGVVALAVVVYEPASTDLCAVPSGSTATTSVMTPAPSLMPRRAAISFPSAEFSVRTTVAPDAVAAEARNAALGPTR